MTQQEYKEQVIDINKNKHRQPLETLIQGRKEENNNQTPISENSIIYYTASQKLVETDDNLSPGLHTSGFNSTIKSHTFENGVGTITFKEDVTTIGDYAFSLSSNLTSVTIPNSVTTIGNDAFWGTGITSLNIPASVTTIGDSAFFSCKGLISVTIPDTVISMGESVFYDCTEIVTATLSNSLTTLKNNLFADCSKLRRITIPASVTSIGSTAFQNCSQLIAIWSKSTTAPTIQANTFQGVHLDGELRCPVTGTGYDQWLDTEQYYLGYYRWELAASSE